MARLKLAARGALDAVADRSTPALGPPTAEERALADRLRRAVAAEPDEGGPVSGAWRRRQEALRRLVTEEDPRGFLRWAPIRETMFVGNERCALREYRTLRASPEWSTRWAPAVREDPAGRPVPLVLDAATSGNRVHHAYHLHRFEEATGRRVDSFDAVVEFGGGYGGMCRLVHRLGFGGRYVILDLPLLQRLQEYYLALAGGAGRVEFGSGRADIDALLEGCRDVLFVATWSLSEAPPGLRDDVLRAVERRASAVLLAYQGSFGGYDNVAYFARWRERVTRDFHLHDLPVPTIRESRYVFGARRAPEGSAGAGAMTP